VCAENGVEEDGMHKVSWRIVVGLVFCAGAAIAGPLDELPQVTPDGNASRESIPDAYKWKLEHLYPSDDAWSRSFEEARAELGELKSQHGEMSETSALARYLDAYFRLELEVNRLKLYASNREVTDTTNQQASARHQRALGLANAIMEEGSFMRQTILGMSEEELSAAFAETPELEEFRPAIDSLRRRADRILDPEAERVLSLAGDNLWAAIDLNELPSPLEQAFLALRSELPLPTITDEEGNEVQLTMANYSLYRASADRRVRREAVEGLFSTLADFESTNAATLGGQAQFDVFLARSRHYDTALEAYLDKDELDPEVYHTLIDTVRAHTPALHRYVELRRKVLDLDEVHLYDLYVPLTKGVDRDIPYAEAGRIIVESLVPLGSEYQEAVKWLLDPDTGCVDVYPSKGKQSGAFSSSIYGVHPFIKMNYQNQYDDMSTLTHEFGHAVHSHMSNSNQPYLKSRYTMFLAEIASTCNEMLLSKYMVENTDSDAERAWFLSELADSIRGTIYRQTQFAEFELRLHELAEAGEPMTAERLNAIYEGLLRDYYGPDYAIDPHDVTEWAYIPHFYYKYYVFVYATGMSSGIALAERIDSGVPGSVEDYLEMLRSGNSKPPLELLKGAGVDLTKPDAIEAAMKLFEETVIELENLLLDND
jgi:oligoendopeptidase F